jgi:dienelactone hydrolase
MPDGSNSPEVPNSIAKNDNKEVSVEAASQHIVNSESGFAGPFINTDIENIRSQLELEDRERKTELDGFSVTINKENFGRGDIEIVQIIPPSLTTEEMQRRSRKQIYIPGYDAIGKDEQEKLLKDLLELAKANKDGDHDPVTVVGVSFTGKRANDASLAKNMPEGVEVTQYQLDKALDFVDTADRLVEGRNAELIGFSLGGSIAQLAISMGLRADTVGLFNSAGLYKEAREKLLLHQLVPQETQDAIRKAVGKFGALIKRKGGSNNADDHGSTRIDRLKRSRVEHWSAYRSITYPLLGTVPDVQYIVANGRKDHVYPLAQVRGVLDKVEASNVHMKDMDWEGHGLGGRNKLAQRSERLRDIANVMIDARQTKPDTGK